jgi:penicillin-binding protein 1A
MTTDSHNLDGPNGGSPSEARGAAKSTARLASGPPSRLHSWKRRLAAALLTLLSLLAALLLFLAWTVADVSRHLATIHSLADTRLNKITTIVSSDGVRLATLQTRDQRPVPLDAISPYGIEATIAVEDERFYQHSGVDSRGVLRALWANLRLGNARGQGGSTLTQQLARNLYLSNDKTYRRKIAEMLIARRIEQRYSKRDILEAYLNTVYYGSGNYGIEAAAHSYLGKSARDMTLGEAALLAGIPQRPTAYAPNTHLRAALERRREVLSRLLATGKISSAQMAQAQAERVRLVRARPQSMASWKAPYFVSDVIARLRETYGPEFVYSGVTIETTLDWRMQQAAEQTLREAVRHGGESSTNPNTGAIVSIDPRTGDVRALVGGRDFARDQFDAATRGVRQPGSAFKPLLYAAAFDSGVCTLASTYNAGTLTYPSGGKDYVIHNFESGYTGNVNVLDAIRHSLNTVAVKVCEETGPARVSEYAQRLGIHTPLEPTLPLALGASGVHPLDICSAYTAFAHGGERFEPALIARITDAHGRTVFQDDPATRLVPNFLKPRTLDEINVALREVVTSGTGRAAAPIDEARGKTGTTNSHRDAWFVGYTADLTTAIWVAHVRKEVKREKLNAVMTQTTTTTYLPMGSGTGGQLCAPMWTQFMQAALPIQRKTNTARGIDSTPIAAPTAADMLARLKVEAKEAARRRSLEKGTAEEASKTQATSDYGPALNGSAPIKVTVPDDVQESQTNTEENSLPGQDGANSDSASHPQNDAQDTRSDAADDPNIRP